MNKIVTISGKAKYSITLDPSTWIFDDRKLDLTTYFVKEKEEDRSLEEYTKSVSKHWDREIMEGAVFPPTLKTEKKFLKEKVLTGTFGMLFKPFIENAELEKDASFLLIQSKDGEVELPIETAKELILKFSDNGKPLTADGPVHIYYGDGSNLQNPIKNVTGFIVK
ncbi:peptidyl-prolyl cis-trans isomerase [Neobacillus mesonae]|uniref:peptidyl-prolyl cis-trans isomerase n=1 Tax=Neobacillus mesonae TaxID=1193713 RepID=UPI002042649E|nr:peptidyl-prolyl cis-trans isomerase [Neobacillus mesonae]MCM3568765.1 peptidyl-prolyl cis-trans isomerase [Neobacillus mesonae]